MSRLRAHAFAFGLAALGLSFPLPAAAVEALDGRLQVHGFGESVLRVVSNDFDDDWDVWQWQWILNIETELDIAPDGWGPFSAVSAYARVEARYDCIWSRGCSIFPSMTAFGNETKKVPYYRSNGRETDGFTATTFGDPTAGRLQRGGQPAAVNEAGLFASLFETKGPDQILGTNDDPALLVFGPDLANYEFTFRRVRGSIDGMGNQILGPIRPRDEIVTSIGRFRFYPNPTSPLEENPSCAVSSAKPAQGCRFAHTVAPLQGMDPNVPVGQIGFNTELIKPWHPYPPISAASAKKQNIPLTEASGLYIPSAGLRELLMEEKLDLFDQDFSENELAWNRGGSQQDEKELKEIYLDLEMLDGRLYFRIGKQAIVWGKTELFRSQDQFNPQDLGLSSLPSLEESRIGLWAAKAIYSFYDVGPLEDVRLELAVLLDDFEPVDLGRCYEPYAPLPVCGKSLGLLAHSAAGIGLAGEIRPPAWWNSSRGLEYGARLEFRWRRFSVAVTDFYGFDDFPVAEPIFKYERNVDPRTGRPRMAGSRRGCDPEGLFDGDTAGCLGAPTNRKFPDLNPAWDPFLSTTWNGDQNKRILAVKSLNERSDIARNTLYQHHANQTLFALACAASTGFTDFIPEVASECGFNIFGSGQVFATGAAPPFDFIPVVGGISMIVGGSASLFEAAIQRLSPDAAGILTVVPLNHNDLGPRRCTTGQTPAQAASAYPGTTCIGNYDRRSRTHEGFGPLDTSVGAVPPNTQLLFSTLGGLSSALTPEQQALLGCGAYYGTSCDRQGIDLLNAEASALFQSFPGFEGSPLGLYLATNKGIAQPGTVGFEGGPTCTRVERGKQYVLPGCRGPGDPGYDPRIDGAPYFSELHNATVGSFDLGTGPIPFSNLHSFQLIAQKFGCPRVVDLGTPGPATIPNPTPPPATIPNPANAGRGRLVSENIRLFHPFTCQPFRSEMAALSFNFMALLVVFSGDADNDGFSKPQDFDEFDPTRAFTPGRCSLVTPQFCSAVRSILGATGVQRNDLKAGGNGRFGRRDFTWHAGSELVLRYPKRNVPGLSVDFAEDWSKTNWSFEFTWIEELPVDDRDSTDGLTEVDLYNLTISVDRPTFVNFLNANRTFFFNWQLFIRYVPQYQESFTANGPWNFLATFTTLTGYFQDRLLLGLTFVYDVQSNSGAGLPSVTYRFSENFSASFGMNFFFGRFNERVPYLMPPAIGNRVGRHAYSDFVENGLAVVRDRDEFYLRLRYTF